MFMLLIPSLHTVECARSAPARGLCAHRRRLPSPPPPEPPIRRLRGASYGRPASGEPQWRLQNLFRKAPGFCCESRRAGPVWPRGFVRVGADSLEGGLKVPLHDEKIDGCVGAVPAPARAARSFDNFTVHAVDPSRLDEIAGLEVEIPADHVRHPLFSKKSSQHIERSSVVRVEAH